MKKSFFSKSPFSTILPFSGETQDEKINPISLNLTILLVALKNLAISVPF